MNTPGSKEHLRRRLYLAAHEEVKAIQQALPGPLREHTARVPVIFDMTPHPSLLRDGIEPDTLGLFTGPALAEALDTAHVAPPEILLYMENIWHYARHDATDYREEIRRTYLHELGHYLGLDEDDLYHRDLD